MSSIDDKLDFNLSDEQKRIVFENLDESKKLSCLKAFKVAKKFSLYTFIYPLFLLSFHLKKVH